MTKAEIISELAKRAEISKAVAGNILDHLFDPNGGIIVKAMDPAAGGFNITGFGTLGSKSRAARQGVNPATGAKITIAATTAAFFKPGKTLKDQLNGK